jgi:hypothetical protein
LRRVTLAQFIDQEPQGTNIRLVGAAWLLRQTTTDQAHLRLLDHCTGGSAAALLGRTCRHPPRPGGNNALT